MLVVAIVLLFKKLINMKNDKLIEFSLVRATVSALAPIVGFAAYIVNSTATASVPAL